MGLLTTQASAIPMDDAAAVWSMSDAGGSIPLQIHGKAKLGVELEGEDRKASLALGGDGRVAELKGGYLALKDDAALRINPKQWTITIRMKDPSGLWDYPILGSYGSDKTVSIALRALDGRTKPMFDRNHIGGWHRTIYYWLFTPSHQRKVPGSTSLIELVWGAKEPNAPRVELLQRQVDRGGPEVWPNPLQQNVLNAVMKPCFPAGLIGLTDWHEITVQMTGPKLKLWIDGVLVDEELPLGETRPRSLPFLIAASHENGELKTGFNGLIDHVAVWNRALDEGEIRALSGGPERVRQRELAILGDVMENPQYFRCRGHNRKAGDSFPYWDAQTQTFRNFYLILRRNMHSKWDGGHGGLEIWQMSSKDLKAWEHHPVTVPILEQWEAWKGTGDTAFKDGKYYIYYPLPDYDTKKGGGYYAISNDCINFTQIAVTYPGGDCDVIEGEDGRYYMTTKGPTVDGKRTFTLSVSDDLVNWEKTDSQLPAYAGSGNCMSLFKFKDWWYFMNGGMVWRSRNMKGPFDPQSPLKLDRLGVPKTAQFGKDRRLYVGFLMDDGWGGNLVFRELVQTEDGWLGLRYVEEMIPATGEPVEIDWPAGDITLQAGETLTLPGIVGDVRIQAEVVPSEGATAYGIEVMAGDEPGSGLPVTVNREKHSLHFKNPGWDTPEVSGLDGSTTLDIITYYDMVDVELADRRTHVIRWWNPNESSMHLFAKGGEVTFRNLTIRPVTETYVPYPVVPTSSRPVPAKRVTPVRHAARNGDAERRPATNQTS